MKCDESKKKLFEFHQAFVKKLVDANCCGAKRQQKKAVQGGLLPVISGVK